MLCFLETDIREQKKYEKRIKTSVDNTVNNLRYEIKFEIKLFFFKQKYISCFETYEFNSWHIFC